MKKLFVFLFICIGTTGLVGCKNVAVDSTGAVPADVAADLTSYRGSYQGILYIKSTQSLNEILNKDFVVDFDVRGDRPVISSREDILGKGCDSKIGNLSGVTVGGIWKAIATFEFDPGKCGNKATGRVANIYIGDDKIYLTIQKDVLPAMGSRGGTKNSREYTVSLKKINS